LIFLVRCFGAGGVAKRKRQIRSHYKVDSDNLSRDHVRILIISGPILRRKRRCLRGHPCGSMNSVTDSYSHLIAVFE
jgi:hypothetical protein